MKIILTRTFQNEVQTIGHAILIDESGQKLANFSTLELPNLDNAKSISCIPTGKYKVVKRFSEKYGHHFWVIGVKGRSMILIHSGNYHTQTQGCILVGSEHKYLNQDNALDIVNSKMTMNVLNAITPTRFELLILNGW